MRKGTAVVCFLRQYGVIDIPAVSVYLGASFVGLAGATHRYLVLCVLVYRAGSCMYVFGFHTKVQKGPVFHEPEYLLSHKYNFSGWTLKRRYMDLQG